MAVLPFDNLTPEPTLTQEVTRAVREAVESRLGLRPAGQEQADAVVSGTIQRYDPDLPLAYTGQTADKVTEVTKRMVQITVNVQILNQKENKVLWERRGLLVQGEYDPGREIDGRRKALEKLVNDIVDGAQSQW
ncbi:MAG TPA: LPS assembly lipoprotein LptE [Gemmatimonadales bacterium]